VAVSDHKGTTAVKLYHFTSYRHLWGIAQCGLTVGDVPTDVRLNQGLCGVWFTMRGEPEGHGLEHPIVDKKAIRLSAASIPRPTA